MRQGFTFVEVILGLFFIPIILSLSLAVLHLMQGNIESRIGQEEVFLLQIRQYLMHANGVDFVNQMIVGTYLNETFEIVFDRNRLVKRPGYEILLEGVVAVYREDVCLIIVLEAKDLCLELP